MLKVKLVQSLIWPIITYGAEAWTLRKADEKRIKTVEMWLYRRMLRIGWREHRTNESILRELNITPGLLAAVVYKKLSYFGHTCREGGCDLTRSALFGRMPGPRRRGRPRLQYTDNVKKWTRRTLTENVRLAQHREEWRQTSRRVAVAAHRL